MPRNAYQITIMLPSGSNPSDVDTVVDSLSLPEGSVVTTSKTVNESYHAPPGGGKPEPDPATEALPAEEEPS